MKLKLKSIILNTQVNSVIITYNVWWTFILRFAKDATVLDFIFKKTLDNDKSVCSRCKNGGN